MGSRSATLAGSKQYNGTSCNQLVEKMEFEFNIRFGDYGGGCNEPAWGSG